MKRQASWLVVSTVLVLVACAGGPGVMPDHGKVLDEWRVAWVDGDFDLVLGMMSPTFKSHWVFKIYEPDVQGQFHAIAKKHIKTLPESDLKEFMNWLQVNKASYDRTGNVTALPDNMLDSEWARTLLKEWFGYAHPSIKHELSAMKITSTPEPEDNRATIIVKNIRGENEFYEMISIDSAWYVHYHRTAPPK